MALCCFLLSFFHINPSSSDRRTGKVERMLHKRENILQRYVDKALEIPEDQWLDFDDFPEDMVLYRYVDGELQSWINTFPISNDGLYPGTSWYRIHDLLNRNIFNLPLAFLDDSPQYVNLGHSWYLVKQFEKDNMLVIGAIESQPPYISMT